MAIPKQFYPGSLRHDLFARPQASVLGQPPSTKAATTRAQVRAFHEAGLANGGTDEGAAGPRAFTPTAYAAYLRDPAGNKLCAYCFADGE